MLLSAAVMNQMNVLTLTHLPGSLTLSELPCGLACKESACNARDLGSIPGLGSSPGEGKDYPLQYSGLESSMDFTHVDMTEQLSLHFRQSLALFLE